MGIDLLQADGNALPSAVKLAYSPASKTFESYRVMTQVHTNDATKKVIVKLADTPQLTDVLNSCCELCCNPQCTGCYTVQMPISVSWGGQVLSTTAKEFEAAALGYSASGVNGVSSSQELVISAAPKTAGTAPTAGNYSGVVSLVMTLGSAEAAAKEAAAKADKNPGSENMTNTIGPHDRGGSSPIYNILNSYLTAYNGSHHLYDRMSFLCLSSQNTLNGACPSSDAPGTATIDGETNITLQFTEKRSLIKRELQIKGYKQFLFKNANCPSKLALNSSHFQCNREQASGATLSLYIPAGELNKLPFGGVWNAVLKLNVKRRYDTTYGTYTINITVNLTDKGNIQIWLPQFGGGGSGGGGSAPQSITELCSEYRNTQIYTINDKILSYTESMAGKREMVIITFKSGATFQVEVPGSQHIDSQKKAIERMKDTLRITYLTETKIDKLCVWNNKTPNSIAAISMENHHHHHHKDEL
nr:CfaB(St)/CfaE/LTB fusion protein [synthetic construct]